MNWVIGILVACIAFAGFFMLLRLTASLTEEGKKDCMTVFVFFTKGALVFGFIAIVMAVAKLVGMVV